MTDLALDVKTGDLVFGQDAQGATLAFVISGPLIVQRVSIRLQSLLGEWFLDTTYGLPWFENILTKNPDYVLIRGLIYAEVMKVPYVTRITVLDLAINRATRALTVTLEFYTNIQTAPLKLVLTPIRKLDT